MPRNCPRYLQTTLIMGVGGLVSEFMWVMVSKNKWKIKEGLEKPGIFWYLGQAKWFYD